MPRVPGLPRLACASLFSLLSTALSTPEESQNGEKHNGAKHRSESGLYPVNREHYTF